MTRTKNGTRCPGTRWFGATSPGTRMVPCWLVWRPYKPKSETKPIQNISCLPQQARQKEQNKVVGAKRLVGVGGMVLVVLYYMTYKGFEVMNPVRGHFIHIYNKLEEDNRPTGMVELSRYQRSCYIFRGAACMNYQYCVIDKVFYYQLH